MKTQVLEAIDRRIAEVSRRSTDAQRAYDDATMYRLNTAYHWLSELREEIAAMPSQNRVEKER